MSKHNRRENRRAVRRVMARREEHYDDNNRIIDIKRLKRQIQDAKRKKNKRLQKKLERELQELTQR